MGTVYEGYDNDIQRQVAIKTLHPHLISSEEGGQFLARFKREAQLAASCIHPNIVLILEYGSHKDFPYIVMEYVRGKTLQNVLKTNPKIPLKSAISISLSLLKALHIAHKKSIVHRDIKPANIMITADKQVKLADFGIARIELNNELTRAGAVLGTPKYMPREQLLGEPLDARADLYAVTMVFAELIGRSTEGIQVPLSAVQSNDPSLEKKLGANSTYPAIFVPIIEQGLRNNPIDRFQSAKEFANAIRAAYVPTLANAQTIVANPSLSTSHYDSTTLLGDNNNSVNFLDISAEEIQAIENDLAQHIGAEARRILRQELVSSISLAEAIHTVANNIPKEKTRSQFIARWSH